MVKKQLTLGYGANGAIEDNRRGIDRTELYCCRTSGVSPIDYIAIVEGVRKILKETEKQLTVRDLDNHNVTGDSFNSPDWYQQQAMTRRDRGLGIQASAFAIDDLLRKEPYQKQNPHFDVIVVDSDLTTERDDPNNNFIYGFGSYPNLIISVRRFIERMRDSALRQRALTIVGAHEFGHIMDLVNRRFNTGSEGYKEGHCNGEEGVCLMEQVDVPRAKSLEKQTQLLFDKSEWLCKDCTTEISFKRDYLRGLGVSF